jgi:hypothetical protein
MSIDMKTVIERSHEDCSEGCIHAKYLNKYREEISEVFTLEKLLMGNSDIVQMAKYFFNVGIHIGYAMRKYGTPDRKPKRNNRCNWRKNSQQEKQFHPRRRNKSTETFATRRKASSESD